MNHIYLGTLPAAWPPDGVTKIVAIIIITSLISS